MAKSSAMTIRIDPEIKSQADNVLRFLGLTTSEAVTIFLRQVILNNGIPFPVKAPMYNDETLAALREAESIAKNGPHRFNTTDEMFKELGI
ncbi:MAG: type II toxin-antitoxin system RelB/DinJ family antitoxin [Gracilibacteraceae bacterium]|jgi:DNA-damage-inducible protein J|nr:type II toxin-antitoxin system RelB/DinJ family antitoxin [Gracilibacteraceae bacterium]